MKKIGYRILALVLAVCLLAGCKTQEVTHQTVSVEGFSITIPAQMINVGEDGYYEGWEITYSYGGTELLVGKEEIPEQEDPSELLSELDYAQLVAYYYQASPRVRQRENPAILTYTLPGEIENYTYLTAVYLGSDAYWTVMICCPETAFPEMESEFMTYLASVKVD